MKYLIYFTFLFCLFFFACTESKVPKPESDGVRIQNLVLPEAKFISVVKSVERIYLNDIGNKVPMQSNTADSNSDLSLILEPMLNNGLQIHTALKNEIYTSDFYSELSEYEKAKLHVEIDQLEDDQLVELSLIVNVSFYSEQLGSEDINWQRVYSCVSSAIGIEAVKMLFKNSLETVAIETIIGALKHVGKRYLGWIGVGFMIYEFVQCVS